MSCSITAFIVSQVNYGILSQFYRKLRSFPHNSQLCPVETLKQYKMLTAPLRPSTTTNLFNIALVKPHKAVSSATIARWLREILKLDGIDVSIFSGLFTNTITDVCDNDSYKCGELYSYHNIAS